MANNDSESLSPKVRATRGLVVALICDGVLFAVWMGIAVVMEWLADAAKTHGVHDYFALAFAWVSSLSTFILTVIYILQDTVEAVRELIATFKKVSDTTPSLTPPSAKNV